MTLAAGIVPLDDAELWAGVKDGRGPAPLWYYILREAEVRAEGKSLHGVGARIVAEVFVGMLQGDLASFVNHDPRWVPTAGGKGAAFGIADLFAFAEAHAPAGIPPAPAPPGGQ